MCNMGTSSARRCQDKYRAVTDGVTGSGHAILPRQKSSISVNRESIAGSQIDAAFFVRFSASNGFMKSAFVLAAAQGSAVGALSCFFR